MKNKENIAGMFDDTEPYMPGQQQEEGIVNKQEPSAETKISDTYGYLQKLLELEREMATIQQRQIEIQAAQNQLSLLLQDSCKDFKVSLSDEDKELMDKMPEDMAKEFSRYKTGIAEYVNNVINRHKESTIKNIDAACEAKIEKTRKRKDPSFENKFSTLGLFSFCDSAGIQTLDLQNRNLTLYSAKLRSHHKKCVQNYIKKTKPTNSIAQKLV